MTEYTDKTAIVTGAGWGIGYEMSKQLLIRGENVILNDINPDRAEEAREKLAEFHHENNLCIPIAGDAGDPAVIDQMVDVADREFGGIHYVVANAGITTFADFLEYQVSQFHELIHLNLQGSFFLCQKAAKSMIRNDIKGRMIVMSSVTGHQGHRGLTAYGMTKAALDRKSTRLNSSHVAISYAVFCLKK